MEVGPTIALTGGATLNNVSVKSATRNGVIGVICNNQSGYNLVVAGKQTKTIPAWFSDYIPVAAQPGAEVLQSVSVSASQIGAGSPTPILSTTLVNVQDSPPGGLPAAVAPIISAGVFFSAIETTSTINILSGYNTYSTSINLNSQSQSVSLAYNLGVGSPWEDPLSGGGVAPPLISVQGDQSGLLYYAGPLVRTSAVYSARFPVIGAIDSTCTVTLGLTVGVAGSPTVLTAVASSATTDVPSHTEQKGIVSYGLSVSVTHGTTGSLVPSSISSGIIACPCNVGPISLWGNIASAAQVSLKGTSSGLTYASVECPPAPSGGGAAAPAVPCFLTVQDRIFYEGLDISVAAASTGVVQASCAYSYVATP